MSSILEQHNEQLMGAVRGNDPERVRALIRISDPRHQDSAPLRLAAIHGHTQCVELLIPVSDCSALDYESLKSAAAHGRLECVRLLIPHASTQACSTALVRALEIQYKDMAQLLYDVSDLNEALKQVRARYAGDEMIADLKQRIKIQEEHALLSDVVGDAHSSSIRKKM